LNVPPDRRGLINEKDSVALIGFNKLRKESFKKNFIKDADAFVISGDSIKSRGLVNDDNSRTFGIISNIKFQFVRIKLKQSQKINCLVLKEYLKNGQNCKNFKLSLMNKKYEITREIRGSTIGNKKIITFPITSISIIELSIIDQNKATAISEMGSYLIDENLIEK